ncbi:MAG: dihydroorotase [Alphaproteobacteria bacterium GM202ARS2]|nr:dihydroorotase [Alphaproteobacteria bacterium GM202ARS2]
MARTFDLVVHGGTVVTEKGSETASIAIHDGKIADVAGTISLSRAERAIDARGLHILPGVIDSHVHFREPGLTHKEDLASGSRAAVLGGVCCIFDMPNTQPALVDVASHRHKVALAKGRLFCDYGFYVGAHREHWRALPDVEKQHGCVGVKVFMGSSTGSLLIDDEATLGGILARVNRRIAVHCEDEARLRIRADNHSKQWSQWWGCGAHARLRDPQAALNASQRLVRLLHKHKRYGHILHLTSQEEVLWLRSLAPQVRGWVSVEVTPHHLTFEMPSALRRAAELGGEGFAVVNPPIRSSRHRQALWDAVRRGEIATVGSDHAPHTRAEKTESVYPQLPSGMPGVQQMLPIMLNHCHQGRLGLNRLVAMTSANVARVFGLQAKGSMTQGFDADLTLVDLQARRRLGSSRCGWSLYEGMQVIGWPIMTMVRGNLVMREDTVIGEPIGQPCSLSSPL